MIKKNFWRNIHLYLGLLAGLVFFIECLSGALLVFEEEITELIHPRRYFVEEDGGRALAVDELMAKVSQQVTSGEQMASVRYHANKGRTVEISLLQKPDKKDPQQTAPNQGADTKIRNRRAPAGDMLFVDPKNGQVIERLNPKAPTFFKFVLRVHQSLLLDNVGKTILGISTFVVFFILLTGLVLWWPKNVKMLKTRLKLKTSASWKRINHDLHVVLGFYCTFFLLIFLVTSLPWSFKWANEALYTLTGSSMQRVDHGIKIDNPQGEYRISYQQALATAMTYLPDAPYWSIMLSKKGSAIEVSAASTAVHHRNGFDRLRMDGATGEVIDIAWHHESPAGWQLRRYMKPVHTGAIGGMATKTLAFVVCLISATFPVTGLILWINRVKKKTAKKAKKNHKLESV